MCNQLKIESHKETTLRDCRLWQKGDIIQFFFLTKIKLNISAKDFNCYFKTPKYIFLLHHLPYVVSFLRADPISPRWHREINTGLESKQTLCIQTGEVDYDRQRFVRSLCSEPQR